MAADDRTPSAVYALKQRLEAPESEKSELLAELTRLQCNQDAVAEARAQSAATGSVNAASEAASAAGRIVGVRLPVDDDNEEPWRLPPSRRTADPPIRDKTLPERVQVVLGNQVYVDRSALPAPLVARCIRLAAFQNPEFYAAQAMRLPTFGKPRVISCAELFPSHVALPRGCLDALLELLNEHGIRPDTHDERAFGTPLDVKFLGQLTEEQQSAAAELLRHDYGVLAAATAFGKTVVASRVLAARGRNTLIHR